MRHAQAWKCIDRIFGISKNRFPILKSPNKYPYDLQVKLVLTLAGLHNFIFKRNGEEECLVWEQEEEEERWRMSNRNRNRKRVPISNKFDIDPGVDEIGIKACRDRMAEHMWIDYQASVTSINIVYICILKIGKQQTKKRIQVNSNSKS